VKQVTWNGVGEAMSKVVACAEIMKKNSNVSILEFEGDSIVLIDLVFDFFLRICIK